MRRVGIAIFLTVGVCWGQSMTETAAAAAGGSVGGVGGKQVSDGLTAIFEKIQQPAGKAEKQAAKKDKSDNTPVLEVGRGVAKVEPGSVPPPPALPGERVARRPPPPPKVIAALPQPVPVPAPPPPQVTADDLRAVTPGMNRDDVLKMGQPAERITMVDNGHLVEVYSYAHNDTFVGRVRLSDGAVSSAEVR